MHDAWLPIIDTEANFSVPRLITDLLTVKYVPSLNIIISISITVIILY